MRCMCDACEDWDAREPRPALMPADIARRARAMERAMPGEALDDATWRIALGEKSGAIAWAAHLRILEACRAAMAEPAARASIRRKAGRFTCTAAG